MLTAILLTALAAYFAWASTPTTDIWISPGVYPGAPSYTVWREGSNYFAKDANGHIDYSGTNASDIILSLFTIMNSEGGTIAFHVNPDTGMAVFIFDTGFTIPSKIKLLGQGIQRSPRLQFTQTDSSDCITMSSRTGLENLRVYGNAATGNGITVPPGNWSIYVRNVASDHHGKNGILINSSYHIRLDNIACWSNGENGLCIDDSGGVTVGEILLTQGQFGNNTNDGISIIASAATSNIIIEGGTSEGNGRYGGYFRGAPFSVIGFKFENNTEDNVFWTARGQLTGCFFQMSPTNKYGVLFSSAGETALIGCRYGGNWKDVGIDSASANIAFITQELNFTKIYIHPNAENITFISTNAVFQYWNGTAVVDWGS